MTRRNRVLSRVRGGSRLVEPIVAASSSRAPVAAATGSVLVAVGVHLLDRAGQLPGVRESLAVRDAVLAPGDVAVLGGWVLAAVALGLGLDRVARGDPHRRLVRAAAVLLLGEAVLFAVPEVLARVDTGTALAGEGLLGAVAVEVALAGSLLLLGVLTTDLGGLVPLVPTGQVVVRRQTCGPQPKRGRAQHPVRSGRGPPRGGPATPTVTRCCPAE